MLSARHPGSSPLARGLLSVKTRKYIYRRIIPARAGFTIQALYVRSGPWDHPRSRGVYVNHDVSAATTWGSSPLARGLRRVATVIMVGFRIIPARAGFTPFCRSRSVPSADHPRSRGVYRTWAARRTPPAGSSPLARGLLCCGLVTTVVPTDHPRSRGVYERQSTWHSQTRGSSPLARGLLPRRRRRGRLCGIIPARAGFTAPPTAPYTCRWDHPRSRGVYLPRPDRPGIPPGSSPLARGLRGCWRRNKCMCRIIPARAGFTQ